VNGWGTIALSEVAQVFNGKTPSKSEQREVGHPVLKIRDVSELGRFRGPFGSFVDKSLAEKYSSKMVQQGDTLILNAAHNADYVGSKTFYAEPAAYGSLATGEWLIIRPDPKAVDTGFVHHWVRLGSTRQKIREVVNGIHLYPKDVARLKLALPPLSEQRRIAAVLDQADALRAKRREALGQLDTLTQSIFIAMFGDPRRAGSTGSEPTTPRLLGDLARIRTGKLDANAANEDGAYPFFTCAVKTLRINTAAFDCKATLVAGNGDLNVKYYEGKFNAYQRTYVIESLNESHLVPRFLFAFLDLYVAELRKQAIGGVIKYIKLPYLTDAVMQVPDVKTQIDFAARLVQVERLNSVQIRAAAETEALFASLQHRAFAGQLS
jgi:restriction endonuclease S subunit